MGDFHAGTSVGREQPCDHILKDRQVGAGEFLPVPGQRDQLPIAVTVQDEDTVVGDGQEARFVERDRDASGEVALGIEKHETCVD